RKKSIRFNASSNPRSLIDHFFFQAEDGIRDFHVTGVQTCALPISTSNTKAVWRRWRSTIWCSTVPNVMCACLGGGTATAMVSKRSEERRVGKEGGSRWSPWHDKKKLGYRQTSVTDHDNPDATSY